MNLLSLQDVGKQYEQKIILKNVYFHIIKDERIAIVGKNGAGKSSLLDIISGKKDVDSGERMSVKNLQILSLPQKPLFAQNASVEDVLIASMSKLKAANERLQSLHTLIAQGQNISADITREYEQLSAYLTAYNGWDLDILTKDMLKHFALTHLRGRIANSLSGGEQKRLALSALLLAPCDILLLDEPTNHLDVETVEFIESFLLQSRTTLVFISHDRYFIDTVATRIVELDDGTLTSFDGGYMQYLAKKAEILSHLDKAHQKLVKTLKSEEEWLRSGVKARLKRNQGRKNKILAMREEAKKNPALIRKMRLELLREQTRHSQTQNNNRQKCLFEIEHLHKSLGDKCLIKDMSLRILAGEKIAIVGKNGAGKSSFLKMLLGDLDADSGIIKRGDIRIGYFEQHTKILDESKDLLETFCPNGGEHIEIGGKHIHVYGYLKNFLFPKEQLKQKIAALSGGEKNRVALALLFTKNVDILLLDEPTNDLDIQTINVIEAYLIHSECAVIFVSHDRYFVDKLAQKLLIFKGDGEITQSYMPYSQYLALNKDIDFIESHLTDTESSATDTSLKPHSKAHKTSEKTPKLSYHHRRALQLLPQEIAHLENEQKAIQSILNDPNAYDKHDIVALAKQLSKIEYELDEKITQYLELEAKNEALNRGSQD